MVMDLDLEAIRLRLTTWFQSKMPHASELSVSPLQRPPAGASNDTFFLSLHWREAGEGKREELLIRWPPTGLRLLPKYDMREQYLILKHLETTNVPAPRARWLEEDDSVIGRPFYIVERIDGWIPGENPPYHVSGPLHEATPESRAKIWWKAVDTIAAINTLDWEEAGFGFIGVPGPGTDPIDRHIAYYEKQLPTIEAPPPLLESALGWLKKNRFSPKHVSLCWGDARLGNLIYRDEEVVAVLDWEAASLCDPESDLAWFLQTDWVTAVLSQCLHQSPAPRLEGLPGTDETLAYYEEKTGRKVENLLFHQVSAAWRLLMTSVRLETTLKTTGFLPPTVDFTTPQAERLRELLEC